MENDKVIDYLYDISTDAIYRITTEEREAIQTSIKVIEKLDKVKQIVNQWNNDASHSFEDMCKINGIIKE